MSGENKYLALAASFFAYLGDMYLLDYFLSSSVKIFKIWID